MRMTQVMVMLTLLLSGCAVESVRNYSDRPITDKNRGYALLSLGPADIGAEPIHYNVILRRIPNGEPVSILFTKGTFLLKGTPPDFTDNRITGAVYLVPLPDGNYEISEYRVYSPQTFSPLISLPFNINAGQITYIGRFMIGLGYENSIAVVLSTHTDSFIQDTEIARTKFPEAMASYPIKTINF